jgi:hypothetical protein
VDVALRRRGRLLHDDARPRRVKLRHSEPVHAGEIPFPSREFWHSVRAASAVSGL